MKSFVVLILSEISINSSYILITKLKATI